MKKSILCIVFILLVLNQVNAQQVYKSGGTSGSTFLFSFPNYCAKSQCIFLPSDLTNVMSGNITTLYYKYGNGTVGQTMYNYTIQMGQTTATSFTGGNTFFTGLTSVLSSPAYTIPQGTVGNWFPISLTNPFTYDSTKTLIIQFTFDSTLTSSWLTLGTSNSPAIKKIISADVNALTGSGSSGTWQDMGFDLAPVSVPLLAASSASFTLFPNPCKDRLTISVIENSLHLKSRFVLINSLGETTSQIEITSGNSETIDLTSLARGIYFLKEISVENSKIQKIILE